MDGLSFEPVTLGWRGEDYMIPAEKVLSLVAVIEDQLAGPSGLPAVVVLTNKPGPTHARLARAFGAALRFAGATVTDDEVYLSIQSDIVEGRADAAVTIQGAIMALLAIVSPPAALKLRGGAKKKTERKSARTKE